MYGKPVPCGDICALMYAILSANSLRLIFRVHSAVAILRLSVDSYDLVSTPMVKTMKSIDRLEPIVPFHRYYYIF